MGEGINQMMHEIYGTRNLSPCKQGRSLCVNFTRGRCRVLHDTEFGQKKCPFFKTKAMVNKQMSQITPEQRARMKSYYDKCRNKDQVEQDSIDNKHLVQNGTEEL